MSWNIAGHAWAAEILQRHVAASEQRQAYLFCGPQGVGRRTLALRFAQALNCLQPPSPGEACLECRACRQTELMQHPDLSVLERQPDKMRILIDQVRGMQHSLSLSPYEGRFRIGLLLKLHEANEEALNALLKTLEEPPARVILLLTADAPETLLPTVVSRCEVLRLRPMPLPELEKFLQEKHTIPPDQARLYAHLAGGRPGYAIQLAEDPRLLDQRTELVDNAFRMLAARRRDRFLYAEKLSKDKESMRQAMRVWTSLWRDALLVASGANTPLVNLDREEELRRAAGQMDLIQISHAAQGCERALRRLDANLNARLLAEVTLLDWPRLDMTL
jgi:DNA polymerase III subunit delta'